MQDFSNKQKAISKYVTLRQNILTITDKKKPGNVIKTFDRRDKTKWKGIQTKMSHSVGNFFSFLVDLKQISNSYLVISHSATEVLLISTDLWLSLLAWNSQFELTGRSKNFPFQTIRSFLFFASKSRTFVSVSNKKSCKNFLITIRHHFSVYHRQK